MNLDNRAAIYTLNVHLAFTCLAFAYLSLFQRKDMLATKIGQAVTAGIGLFWILRAINQVVFYGLSAPDTPFWVIVCLVVTSFYLISVISKRSAEPAAVPS